MTDRNI